MKTYFLICFGLFLSSALFAQAQTNDVHVVVDKMPKYKGGEEKFLDFLYTHTIYPLEAQEQGIEGVVIVNFIISKDGSIKEIKVKNPVHPILDSAAIAVINQMPEWSPGKKDGEKVDVLYSIPISFTLPKE